MAACSVMTASAIDATAVKVSLNADKPGLANKIVSEVGAKPSTMSFAEGRAKAGKNGWQRISVPIKMEAAAKKLKASDSDRPTPDYVGELTLTVHVLFKTADADGKDKYARVSKTMTYHEIALSKGSKQLGECEMNVDLFLSPRNAMKISTAGPKGKSTAVKVIAIALEGSFGGQTCQRLEKTDADVRFDRTDLPKSWWTSDKVNDCGAVLYALNETPYAAFAPVTDAWVTTDGVSAPAAPAVSTDADTTTPTTDAGATDTDAGAPPTTDDTAATADEEDTGSRSKNKKGSKKTKRSRR